MRVAACLLFLMAAAAADPEKVLTGVLTSKNFEIRYRPGSRAGAYADRVAAMAERELARIFSQLGTRPQGSFKLFLYDDVPELLVITKTSGNAGFSVPGASHIPFDNDQTRYHEMVHIVAERLPRSGDEPRSLFFAEGLANALLEHVHGVHVHAVASFYRQRKMLPPLAEMTGAKDFYAWLRAHPGFNAYDVAASWLRHLFDTYGPRKVVRYYTGTPAKKAFGKDLAKLEASWHRVLDAYELRPEVEMLLRERAGEKVTFLLGDVLGKPSDWEDLGAAALRPKEPDKWSRKDGVVQGRSETQQWSWCELGTKKYGNCAVRATIHAEAGCLGVQLRLGEKFQAMLVQAGTFVWREKPTAHNPKVRLLDGKEIDFLLVRRGGVMEVWLDSVRVLSGRAGADAAPVGLGVAGGSAAFRSVRVRALR